MKLRKTNICILSAALAVCVFSGSVSAVLGAETPLSVTKENASLLLPVDYEQYLPLTNPADAAFAEDYLAIADGRSVYVYDRAAEEYAVYSHTDTVTKLQFSEEGVLYFADEQAKLFYLDPSASEPTITDTTKNSSTFLIEGDKLFTAVVSSSLTNIREYTLSDLDSPARVIDESVQLNAPPHLAYENGALLCAANGILLRYTEGEPTQELLSTQTVQTNGLSSVCLYEGEFYYTSASGLYRADREEGVATLLYEGNDFSALTTYGDALYCVKDTSVLGLEIDGDTASFTQYEICGSSASSHRLLSAVQTVRAGALTVTADVSCIRIYDRQTDEYTVISCDYSPRSVATDGEYVIATDGNTDVYTYDKTGNAIARATVSDRPITGLACIFGECYFVTSGSDYGAFSIDCESVSSEYRNVTAFSPSALTTDLYGNLFVADAVNGKIYRYEQSRFVGTGADDGTPLSFPLPVGFTSLQSDYKGNVYCLKDATLYQNGEEFATVDANGCVYRQAIPAPQSVSIGFESSEIYLQYDNFILASDALAVPALDAIDTENCATELFAPQSPLTLLTVNEGAIGIQIDLNGLQTDDSTFAYQSAFRTEETARGILLAETDEYNLVALFGENRKYTTGLFRKQSGECSPLPQEEYLTQENAVRYITNDVSISLFPCQIPVLRGQTVARAERVLLLATVSAGADYDYDYAYVSYQGEQGEIRGYLPLGYLTSALPEQERNEYRIAWLKENEEGILFTADDGAQITLTERTQIVLYQTDPLTASVEVDGKTYYATVEQSMIEEEKSDAMRISLIVILSVVGVGIIGGYFYLFPRKKEEKNK